GDAELHDRFGRDLDGLAGLWVAADARLAVGLHQAAEAGQNEHAVLLGLLHRGVGEGFQERRSGLVVDAGLLGHVTDKLCLGHASCHESSLKLESLKHSGCGHLIPAATSLRSFATAFYAGFLGVTCGKPARIGAFAAYRASRNAFGAGTAIRNGIMKIRGFARKRRGPGPRSKEKSRHWHVRFVRPAR